MDFRARLVHADAQRRVVQVAAFAGERCLGSALGEAANAEEAEDRARDRLRQRLRNGTGDGAHPAPAAGPKDRAAPPALAGAKPMAAAQEQVVPVAAGAVAPLNPASAAEEGRTPPARPAVAELEPLDPREPPLDPEDWSADLTQLDRHLRTLGWGRDQERIFVRRLFGHPNRSRLTRYADLMLLRRALEALPAGSQPDTAPLPLPRADLLSQCDDLLTRLRWTTERARQSLEEHFAVNSRQRLSDDQLLAFNLQLEGELLGQAELGGADGCLELQTAHSETSPS
ncbi:MAG: hypothetical protein VKO39_14280 [Cyanobacteriota bacterium]|nr:hypothetical protein [Cyanobacteriota bacterium]